MRPGWVISVLTLACATAPPSPQPFISGVIAEGIGEVFRGTFSPSGDEFYFFRKVTVGEEDYRVFRTAYRDGVWAPAVMLPLGDSTASSMYPVVSPDGRSLVFTSYRSVGNGPVNANLWLMTCDGPDWADPVLLGGLSTLENYDASPWFAPDGTLHFTSTSRDWITTWYRQSTATAPPWGPWAEDPLWAVLMGQLTDHHFWSGIVDPTGSIAIAEVSSRTADGSIGPADVWITRRIDGRWGSLQPLDAGVNTAGTENYPVFTPDGTSMVFVRDFAAFLVIDTEHLVPAAR